MGNDHFCDTTKRASQRLTPHIQGEIPLYHRSGNKPLDSTTLVKTNGISFWASELTTHFSLFSGDWDVHWGYDLDFDPWPQNQSHANTEVAPHFGNSSTRFGKASGMHRTDMAVVKTKGTILG